MKLEDVSLRLANSVDAIDAILVASRELYGKLQLSDRQRVAKYILGCNRHNIKIERVQFHESYYSNRIWPDPTKYMPDREYIWSIQIVLMTKKKKVHLVPLYYPFDAATNSCIPVQDLQVLRQQRAADWARKYAERHQKHVEAQAAKQP